MQYFLGMHKALQKNEQKIWKKHALNLKTKFLFNF